jgi:nucleotide-binding universal stress UspA family protein
MKILVATDGLPHSDDALDLAVDLAKRLGASLTVITVNVALLTRGVRSFMLEDAELERILAAAQQRARQAGLAKVETVMAQGRDVSATVVDYAEDNGIDHIVVGTGGPSFAARLLLGSVSSAIIARAHCPVTVARRHR